MPSWFPAETSLLNSMLGVIAYENRFMLEFTDASDKRLSVLEVTADLACFSDIWRYSTVDGSSSRATKSCDEVSSYSISTLSDGFME